MHKSRQEAEIRVRVRRNPHRFFRKVVLAAILTYLVFQLYGFVHDMAVVRLARVEQVRAGVIQKTVPAAGILVRSEKLIPAPRSGKLKVLAAEGERVRVGQAVARVLVPSLDSNSGEAVFDVTTPYSGLVSYHLDNLEEVCTPDGIRELDLEKIETIKSEPQQVMPGNRVEAGKPVLKIVNNLEPLTVIATAPAGQMPKKGGNQSILLVLGQNERDLCRGTILERNFRGNPDQLLIEIKDYDPGLIVGRRIDFKIVTERYEGYVVPLSAIVRKDGQTGIYTVYKERVRWQQVEVEGTSAGEAVISGVTPDLKVILKPEYVEEGSPFR